MTWIVNWLSNYIGSWLGATEPEPEGSMRASLRGASSVSATVSTTPKRVEVFTPPGGGSAKSPPRLPSKDDAVILEAVIAFVLSQE